MHNNLPNPGWVYADVESLCCLTGSAFVADFVVLEDEIELISVVIGDGCQRIEPRDVFLWWEAPFALATTDLQAEIFFSNHKLS